MDLFDQNPLFIEQAKKNLKDLSNVRNYYVSGIQDFTFQEKYDCIWVQWVSSQIVDVDYIRFLQRCGDNLNKKGVIVVKENVTDRGFCVDNIDSSVTR